MIRSLAVVMLTLFSPLLLANLATNAPKIKPVWVAEIRGTIDPASTDYLEQSLTNAQKAGAQALIIELDTPGGLVSSVRKMSQAIDQSKIPVITYVTPAGASATSAGALLMLASHITAMAPGTNVGAAHPVTTDGKEAPGAMGEKVVNDTAAFARGLAELRGRDTKLAEEIVAKSTSLTTQEAIQKKFTDIEATSRADLFKKLNGYKVKIKDQEITLTTEGASVNVTEMTTGQKLLHLLANPNIAAILMSLAMLLIYVEITNPGITVAGVMGAICLLIAFMSFQVLPIRWGGASLLGLGMVLMLLEPFVVTGGALAAGGLLSFVLGLLWFLDPTQTDLVISPQVWIPIALGLGTGITVIAWAAARTRRLSRLAIQKMGGGSQSGLEGYEGVIESLGENDGTSGKVLIRGELWDFKAPATVKVGDHVKTEKVDGMTLTVSKVKQ